MKVYKKKTIHKAMHIIECPKCNSILASASEREFLPEFSTCDECNKIKDETNATK